MDPGAVETILTTGGPWALLIISLMIGWLVPKFQWERVIKENDELKTENKELRNLLYRTSRVAEATTHLAEKGITP